MVNTRGAIKDLAVSVRMVSEMPMTGTDVLGFWSALGFSHVRESLKTGLQYTVPTSSLPVQVGPTPPIPLPPKLLVGNTTSHA